MKLTFLFLFFLLLVGIGKAQTGSNQVRILVEASVPGAQDRICFGGFVKGAYGVGRSAQVTLMSGVSKFKSKTNAAHLESTTRVIPVLLGYKQNIKRFYVEPQLGYGELGGKIDLGGDWARPSVGAFMWALGVGFECSRINMGLRYQNVQGAESGSAGFWQNKTYDFTGIQVGYNLFGKN